MQHALAMTNAMFFEAIEAERARRLRNHELRQIRDAHMLGEITIDHDDPRTTLGLTDHEVLFVRGEYSCDLGCSQAHCSCELDAEGYRGK